MSSLTEQYSSNKPDAGAASAAGSTLDQAIRASTIVIVDDESANFMVLRKVLAEDGYSRVVTTSDSTTAMETIRQSKADLVILDIIMPVVDGMAILRELRRDPVLSDTSVVVLTASNDPTVEQQATDLGVTDFLRKPVNPRELCSRVYHALSADLDFEEPIAEAVEVKQTPPPVPVPAPSSPHPDMRALKTLERQTVRPKRTATGQQPDETSIDDAKIRNSTIVIVDDEPFNFMVLRKFLADGGYTDIQTTSDSTTALQTIIEAGPDLVILDVVMPQVDGIEILTAMKANPDLAHIPVLILTATADARVKKNALDIGATDFLNKPVDSNDLLPRVRNSILYKLQRDQLRDYAGYLEDQVQVRTSELIESRRDIVRCLARAGEYRDTQTGYHVLRVGMYAGLIADELGFSPAEVEDIELAAQLHDLGKIAIPDSILLKPGKLTNSEIREMQRHCRIGMKIIQPNPVLPIASRTGSGMNPNRLIQMAAMIASTHHEHWNGSGYPCGLAGEQIPIEGRITAVADVFDALSSKRPYKEAFDFEECFAIMERDRGKQFDPTVLDALTVRRDEIIEIRLSHEDGAV